MKWLFLLGCSALGTAMVVALSGVAAGKNVLSGLDLLSQQPQSSVLFVLLLLEWAMLTNDIAAAKGLSNILGQSVEFREVKMYGGADAPGPLISLRMKLYVVYPYFMVFFVAILTIQISRL